jgi:hypothetical protein
LIGRGYLAFRKIKEQNEEEVWERIIWFQTSACNGTYTLVTGAAAFELANEGRWLISSGMYHWYDSAACIPS